jgi:hypothetical protein
MIIQLLALVVVIVAAYQVFKTARDNGRSGGGWAAITVVVDLGLQWVLPVLLGVILAIIYMATGSRAELLQTELQTPAIIIGFVCVGLSFVAVFLILKFVSRIPDDAGTHISLPPPPTFDDAGHP